MHLIRRPDYRSDTTQFINKLKSEKPTLVKVQRAGRAIFWDKKIDRKLQHEFTEGRIEQQPYVYQAE